MWLKACTNELLDATMRKTNRGWVAIRKSWVFYPVQESWGPSTHLVAHLSSTVRVHMRHNSCVGMPTVTMSSHCNQKRSNIPNVTELGLSPFVTCQIWTKYPSLRLLSKQARRPLPGLGPLTVRTWRPEYPFLKILWRKKNPPAWRPISEMCGGQTNIFLLEGQAYNGVCTTVCL